MGQNEHCVHHKVQQSIKISIVALKKEKREAFANSMLNLSASAFTHKPNQFQMISNR